MIKSGCIAYGPTAKQLGKLAERKIVIQPETIDTDGYFLDGKKAATAGRVKDPGCKLIENINAYIAGYKTGERIHGYLCR